MKEKKKDIDREDEEMEDAEWVCVDPPVTEIPGHPAGMMTVKEYRQKMKEYRKKLREFKKAQKAKKKSGG